jgi:ABC-2 type transport system permease protein
LMGSSFTAELLKLRKRPAVWILGAIWLAFVILLVYALPYAFFANLPQQDIPEGAPADLQSEMQAQNEAASEQLMSQLYPENLASYMLSGFSGTGGTLALILGALAVGSEYGWRTLKTVLSQRPGRLGAFFAKMLALAVTLALFVALAFVAGAVCSLVVAVVQGAPIDFPPLAELLEALGAGAIILAVWAALGIFLATLFRSTALAIGLGLFYALALEGLVFGLPIPNETFQNARQFFLGQNSGFLANSFGGEALQQNLSLSGSDVGAAQAALVLCIYLAVFVLVAALVFRQRDVA